MIVGDDSVVIDPNVVGPMPSPHRCVTLCRRYQLPFEVSVKRPNQNELTAALVDSGPELAVAACRGLLTP